MVNCCDNIGRLTRHYRPLKKVIKNGFGGLSLKPKCL